MFFATALVVLVVLGGALLLTGQRAGRAADDSLDRALQAAESSIQDALTSRSRQLWRVTDVIARQAPVRAAIEEAIAGGDRGTLLNQADEIATFSGADWVLLTDPSGVLMASTFQPGAFGDLLEGSLVGIPLAELEPVEGLWIEVGPDGEDLLFQAVGVPMLRPGTDAPVALVVAAAAIDSLFAAELARHTNTDVVFFALDTIGVPRVTVSTLAPALVADSLAAFDVEAAFASGSAVAARVRIPTGDDALVGTVGALTSAGGGLLGGYAALRSRAAELVAFTRLRQTIMLAFGAGLVLALLSSLVLARQITGPVRRLAAVTRDVVDGNYGVSIDVATGDEIGELADAFRHMLRDLKEKQELVDYLSEAGGTTVRLTAAEVGAVTATPDRSSTQRTGELAVGATLANRYEIQKILGAGGMGVVYRAHDRQLDETVALKTLRPDAVDADATTLERFKQEIRLARRITHRFVVRTHDFGEANGLYYITMEYVEGKNLKDLIRKSGRLPVAVTLTIGKQICRALQVAHEQGIIHRDVKPQNIAVDPGGYIKVMDFGIARLAERGAETDGLTAVGTAIGTPDYMAPEQLMGEALDVRADLYAAGAVLFECLTGRTVFAAPTLPALMAKHLEETPEDPRTLEPSVPPGLAGVVLRALAKQPDDRFPSAAAMLEALESVAV